MPGHKYDRNAIGCNIRYGVYAAAGWTAHEILKVRMHANGHAVGEPKEPPPEKRLDTTVMEMRKLRKEFKQVTGKAPQSLGNRYNDATWIRKKIAEARGMEVDAAS